MDKIPAYHPPEAYSLPLVTALANVPEQRFSFVEVQLDPLPPGERFLADLDDDALDQLASAMASQGIAA